jgi:hypothetical protein
VKTEQKNGTETKSYLMKALTLQPETTDKERTRQCILFQTWLKFSFPFEQNEKVESYFVKFLTLPNLFDQM